MKLVDLISRTASRVAVSPANIPFHTLRAVVSGCNMNDTASPLFGIDEERIMARCALLRVTNQVSAPPLFYLLCRSIS
jgi:hypothetical protein